MGVFKRFLPEMSLECRRSILFVHIAIGKEGPWSVEVQEQFARLGSLPGLETVYVSGVLDDAHDDVDDEDEGPATDCEYRARMALSYRGRSTMHSSRRSSFETFGPCCVSTRIRNVSRGSMSEPGDGGRLLAVAMR